MYRWKSLVFTYKSTSSDVISSTSGALGTVSLATDYNSLDSAYTNVREMNNSEHCNTSRPSTSFMHVVEPKYFQQKQYYVRSGEPRAGSDKRLYDPASTTLATQGMAVAGGGIGQIWVTYTVEFIKPVFDSNLETNSEIIVPTYADVTNSTNIRPFGALTPAGVGYPSTAGLPTSLHGNIGLSFEYSATHSYIYFPKIASGKTFMIYWHMKGTGNVGVTTSYLSYDANDSDIGTGGSFREISASYPGTTNGTGDLANKYFLGYVTLGSVDDPVYGFYVSLLSNSAAMTGWPTACTGCHLTVTGIDTAALASFL